MKEYDIVIVGGPAGVSAGIAASRGSKPHPSKGRAASSAACHRHPLRRHPRRRDGPPSPAASKPRR
ncbi:MAG: hypothetical protein ACLSVD_09395 [Eggerthellaceae bacterium]